MIARTLLCLLMIYLVGVACAIANAATLTIITPSNCTQMLTTVSPGHQQLKITCGKAAIVPAEASKSAPVQPQPVPAGVGSQKPV